MKIAILTLIGHHNYGNLLQAYALQTMLKRMGHEVTILKREPNYPSFKLLLLRVLSTLKCAIRIFGGNKDFIICNPLAYPNEYKVRKSEAIDYSQLKLFSEQNLSFSPSLRRKHSLKKYVKKHKFDCFIVGSDQVWREAYTPDIYNYFLDFLSEDDKSLKISYAASFGTNNEPISADKLPYCVELSKRFNAISVREQSAIDLVHKYFHLSAVQVLDPTLLLDPIDYYKLINDRDKDKGKGALVSYIFDKDQEKDNIISTCQNKLSCNHIDLMNLLVNKKGCKQMYSISEWLATITNAKFIVTDSFHGCVFSILFRKQFVIIANEYRGSERLKSILEIFSLQNRLFYSLEDFLARKEDVLCNLIDYSIGEQRFNTLRIVSKNFLNVNIC